MKLVVNDQVHLSEFRSSDKEARTAHLNDREIYDRTLRLPFPYTDASADEWLAPVAKSTTQQGRPVHWAIRTTDDALIGGCGFDGFQVGKSHQAEVGYWLAKPYWGRGIMTAVMHGPPACMGRQARRGQLSGRLRHRRSLRPSRTSPRLDLQPELRGPLRRTPGRPGGTDPSCQAPPEPTC